MTDFSADEVWSLSDKELIDLLNSGALLSKSRKITFYTPSFAYHKRSLNCSSHARFPTISVTGTTCALNCKHCGGKVLKTMYSAETPERLFKLAERLKSEGAVGCLVSGGCLPSGSVPLERFVPAVARMKRELGFTVIVHTGIISFSTAKALKQAEVDAALIDVVGSDATMKQVLNLSATADYYEHALHALHAAGLNFVPHVIIGLQNGKLEGELQALKIIRKFEPSALIVIAFMPIRGTEMEAVEPPTPSDIARVIATARLTFPKTPLALGCMRPKGKHRAKTDVLALKAGVDAIAFPSEEVVRFAKKRSFGVAFSLYCCSQIYADMSVRSASK
jgi:uncharacterized radical SAM superfamily protein